MLYSFLQALLTSASRQLYAASAGGRFASVDVVLPPSWAGTACAAGRNATVADVFLASSGSGGDSGQADFRVSGPHPVFGSEPRAAQYGRCGAVGRGVDLPYTMMTEFAGPEGESYSGGSMS